MRPILLDICLYVEGQNDPITGEETTTERIGKAAVDLEQVALIYEHGDGRPRLCMKQSDHELTLENITFDEIYAMWNPQPIKIPSDFMDIPDGSVVVLDR